MMSLEEYIGLELDGWEAISETRSYETLAECLTNKILDAVRRGEIKELSLTTKA